MPCAIKHSESDPIASLSAERTSDSSLNVTWERPDRPNGRILRYRIDIYKVSTDCRNKTTMHTPVQTDGTAVSKVVGSLCKFQCWVA